MTTLSVASIKNTCYNRDLYEPSDDSFLVVDALLQRAKHWGKRPPCLCVEIGSGSGYVICSLALALKDLGVVPHCIATDINPAATQATATTLRQHSVPNADVLQCNLLDALLPRLAGKVDVLVFNPPYVPTPQEEVERGGIAAAWAGGHRGRVVTDRLLPLVGELLSRDGEFFLVTVPDNDPQEIASLLKAQGLSGRTLLTRSADEELLSIQHFCRTNSQ